MLRVGAALALIAGCRAEAPAQRAPEPQPLPKAGTSPDEYIRRYGGEYVPEIKNASNGRDWEEAFMKRYASEYQQYVRDWKQTSAMLAAAPQEPAMCSDMKCLDAWHKSQLAMLKQYVPESYAPFAEATLQKEYEHFKSIIESKASTPAPSAGPVELVAGAEQTAKVPEMHSVSDGQEWFRNFMREHAQMHMHYMEDEQRLATEFAAAPASASDCHTLAELKEWRDAQLARIKAYVPKAYQGFATKSLDDEFDSNQARIAKEAANVTTVTHAPAVLMAVSESPQGQAARTDYASQWIPHPEGSGSASPEWYINRYAHKHAGDNVPRVHNASDIQEWRQHFMSRYAEAYHDYAADEQSFDSKFGDAPQHASDCRTLGALERWHEAQKARINSFVPKTYQDTAYDSLNSQFQANKARIARESTAAQSVPAQSAPAQSAPVQFAAVDVESQPKTTDGYMNDYRSQWVPHPMAAAHSSAEWYVNRYAGGSVPTIHNASDGHEWRRNFLSRHAEAYQHYAEDSERLSRQHADAPEKASDARSVKELEAWKGAQLARIDEFVPQSFQKTAKDSVEQSFRRHRALLQQQAASAQSGAAAPGSGAAPAPAAAQALLAEEAREGQRAAGVSALLAVSVAGALLVSFAYYMGRRYIERDDMADGYMQV